MSETSVETELKKDSTESNELIKKEVENGKNKHLVKCKFCPSRILNPRSGLYSESKVSLKELERKEINRLLVAENIGHNSVSRLEMRIQNFDLPMMTKKKSDPANSTDVESETLNYFWQINDMYTFENICFSNTVDNIKYLACADCEIGPVGYFNMNTKISYVALARVNHAD